jgi:hypothetical protein
MVKNFGLYLKKIYLCVVNNKIKKNMKYKAIYKSDSHHIETIGVFKTKDEAIKALLRKGDGNYCLDSREERQESLELRNFCMCGCGPSSMSIEEVCDE